MYVHCFSDTLIFNSIGLIIGSFGPSFVAAHFAFSNSNGYFFRTTIALSKTIISHAGNELGYSNIKAAIYYYKTGINMLMFYVAAFVTLLVFLKESWETFYT